ncbi:MAG: N-formylglutamate amidohydrolase [Gammaproteobacteria bacterium]|nr:N-formylglutamate amidohydrolase [Gammaproteobacteria bacterium]MDH3465765.1 N-formylglutamate amidohydrolase [Gammaproteobacteria bacterium]
MTKGLLAPGDPPPYTIENSGGTGRCLILCDHASNRIPPSLGQLGLSDSQRAQHVAYDIGSMTVAREFSHRFDAPLIMGNYSRLVIDLNRYPGNPASIAAVSDGIPIPGNVGVTEADAAQRADEIFHPYHNAIRNELTALRRRYAEPCIISIHSFTPVFGAVPRPWHVGVLWGDDPLVAQPLLARLRREVDLCVGDNQPYDAREPLGYSMNEHGAGTGLPHVLLEIRQDLITEHADALTWAARLHECMADVIDILPVNPALAV